MRMKVRLRDLADMWEKRVLNEAPSPRPGVLTARIN
jgi:hypothetical protein